MIYPHIDPDAVRRHSCRCFGTEIMCNILLRTTMSLPSSWIKFSCSPTLCHILHHGVTRDEINRESGTNGCQRDSSMSEAAKHYPAIYALHVPLFQMGMCNNTAGFLVVLLRTDLDKGSIKKHARSFATMRVLGANDSRPRAGGREYVHGQHLPACTCLSARNARGGISRRCLNLPQWKPAGHG